MITGVAQGLGREMVRGLVAHRLVFASIDRYGPAGRPHPFVFTAGIGEYPPSTEVQAMNGSFAGARFRDRADAGCQLAARLSRLRIREPVIYALPRGGVPVGAEIARVLKAPLDLILARKIEAPGAPEVALGAVVDGAEPLMVVDRKLRLRSGADDAYIERAVSMARREIERRRLLYIAGREPIDPTGHVAIVVDDGIATGATMLAAVASLRQRGAGGICGAVPIAPWEEIGRIARRVDNFVCLHSVRDFVGVGAAYEDFHQLTDEEVLACFGAGMIVAPRFAMTRSDLPWGCGGSSASNSGSAMSRVRVESLEVAPLCMEIGAGSVPSFQAVVYRKEPRNLRASADSNGRAIR